MTTFMSKHSDTHSDHVSLHQAPPFKGTCIDTDICMQFVIFAFKYVFKMDSNVLGGYKYQNKHFKIDSLQCRLHLLQEKKI